VRTKRIEVPSPEGTFLFIIQRGLRNLALYENLVVQQRNMEEYEKLINNLDTERLLRKSLQPGELTISEYIKEKDEFFFLYDDYTKVELSYYQALASLYHFKIKL
jgi:hypothetical protein